MRIIIWIWCSTIGKTVFLQILYEHSDQGFKEFKFIEFLLILYKMYQENIQNK